MLNLSPNLKFNSSAYKNILGPFAPGISGALLHNTEEENYAEGRSPEEWDGFPEEIGPLDGEGSGTDDDEGSAAGDGEFVDGNKSGGEEYEDDEGGIVSARKCFSQFESLILLYLLRDRAALRRGTRKRF